MAKKPSFDPKAFAKADAKADAKEMSKAGTPAKGKGKFVPFGKGGKK